MEISQIKLWVTHVILLPEAVILASDRQDCCPARRNISLYLLFAHTDVKSGAENKSFVFAKRAPFLRTDCISSTIGDYPFPTYPKPR